MARLIADPPKLKAAVDDQRSADGAGVHARFESQLNESQLKSNLLLVTNKSGRVLARFGTPERAALVIASQPAMRDALAGRESVSLLPQPDGMLQLVTVPIVIGPSQPEILGTLSVGFLLDDALAEQLKQITGSDIAFGMDGQILAATLAARHAPGARRDVCAATASRRVRIGGEEYVALPRPLQPGSNAAAGSGPGRADPALAHRAAAFLDAIHTDSPAPPSSRSCSRRSSASPSRGRSRARSPRSPT